MSAESTGAAQSAETTPYEEVQDLPWPFMALGVGGGALSGIALARALSLGLRLGAAGVAAAGIGLAVGEFLAPLRTTLMPDEIQVRFGRRTRFRIPLKHVKRAYARRYHPLREYGGWGIRESAAGRAFTISGNEGVQLELRSGKRVLIGSRRAEEFASAIRRITGCEGAPPGTEPCPPADSVTVEDEGQVVE